MYRKTNEQGSLFTVDTVFPDLLPDDDWSYTYREHVLPLIVEKEFRHLYAKEGGKPNKSIQMQVSLLIFMGLEKHNWRGAEFQLPRRLDWMNAIGLPLGEANIDHTTLFKFFQKLENDATTRNLFETVTNKFIELCGTSVKKQRTDSFFIHGWLKILSRYGLFKETIRVFLEELNKKSVELYEKTASGLSKKYIAKSFDLTEKDHDKVKKRIKEMARDMYILIHEFENNEKIKNYESFRILNDVFNQQCKVVETEEELSDIEIEIRERPEGKKIINTPHNTDAEYVKKNYQKVTGHKGFVTETCDGDNETQFITDINVTASTKSDSKEVNDIEERLEDAEMKPEDIYGDAGFVNGKTILDAEEKGMQLEGPSAGRSQSFEEFQGEDRPLDAADFKTSVDNKTGELNVDNCPNNEMPKDQERSKKTGKVNVHFDIKKCATCTLKERCPVKIGKNTATVTIDEIALAGSLRHHQYMNDSDYRKECATRAGAEATVNEIANAHGMRKAKHRKTSQIKLQMIIAGIACNVKRFIRHGEKYGYLDLQSV
ncbi:MAG: hypothetical protein GY714_15275 [Desulfobacterales bacterium]|nr:hypothetical protein [Desulfobacterales bacterium]